MQSMYTIYEYEFNARTELTLWNTTSKSSSFPCKSPQMVTCLDMAVEAWFKFGERFSRAVASFRMPATYLACNRLYCVGMNNVAPMPHRQNFIQQNDTDSIQCWLPVCSCQSTCNWTHEVQRKQRRKKLDFFRWIVSVIYSSIKKNDKWTAEDLTELSVCSIKHVEWNEIGKTPQFYGIPIHFQTRKAPLPDTR